MAVEADLGDQHLGRTLGERSRRVAIGGRCQVWAQLSAPRVARSVICSAVM